MPDGPNQESKAFRREKIIILAVWFVGLIGVRLLMASLLALEGTWVATIGSMGIIFAIFYVALRYTPLSRYAGTVNSALLSWFSKRYFLWGAVSSMIVLSSLIFFAEFGYHNYSEALVTFEQFENLKDGENPFDVTQKLSSSSEPRLAEIRERYGIIGAMAILVASVDESLGGYYVMAISFILAEDIEVFIFMILVRRSGERGLFQGTNAKLDRKLREYSERA
jgi:hypothetical protein